MRDDLELNIQNKNGHTTLSLAVLGGYTELMQLVINHASDVLLTNSSGQTLLDSAQLTKKNKD